MRAIQNHDDARILEIGRDFHPLVICAFAAHPYILRSPPRWTSAMWRSVSCVKDLFDIPCKNPKDWSGAF